MMVGCVFAFCCHFYEEGIRRFELAKRAQDICFLAKCTTKFELISDHNLQVLFGLHSSLHRILHQRKLKIH